MKAPFAILVCLVLSAVLCIASPPVDDLRDGDLLFQDAQSAQSEAIRRATGFEFTHIGIFFLVDGEPMVLEAVGPVKATSLDSWIARGRDRRFAAMRLASRPDGLSPKEASALRKTCEGFLGLPYDAVFAWSDERIYCSELVYKGYIRALSIEIGRLRKLRDFDLSHPVVKAKLAERYGDDIPLDETVISPRDVFESKLLAPIASEDKEG